MLGHTLVHVLVFVNFVVMVFKYFYSRDTHITSSLYLAIKHTKEMSLGTSYDNNGL